MRGWSSRSRAEVSTSGSNSRPLAAQERPDRSPLGAVAEGSCLGVLSDPGPLQRPPLPRRHPRHQRQVVIGSPTLTAHIAPPADRTVLDRLRVDPGRRVPANGGRQQPPRLPLISGEVVHAQREAEPGDRRVVRLCLTAAGRAALERADAAYADWLGPLLGATGDTAGVLEAFRGLDAAMDERRRARLGVK